MLHKMIKVKIAVTLDAEDPNDSVVISEARRWKVLQEKGKTQAYLSEQKTVFMAGIYLNTVAPQLCSKLAQNLTSASLDDLQHFSKLVSEKGIGEEQLEGVLHKLSEIHDLINTSIERSIPLSGDSVKEAPAVTEPLPVTPSDNVALPDDSVQETLATTEPLSATPSDSVALPDDSVQETPAVTEPLPVTPSDSVPLPDDSVKETPSGSVQAALPEVELNDKLKKMRKIKSKKIF